MDEHEVNEKYLEEIKCLLGETQINDFVCFDTNEFELSEEIRERWEEDGE